MNNKDRESLEKLAVEFGLNPSGLEDKELSILVTEAKIYSKYGLDPVEYIHFGEKEEGIHEKATHIKSKLLNLKDQTGLPIETYGFAKELANCLDFNSKSSDELKREIKLTVSFILLTRSGNDLDTAIKTLPYLSNAIDPDYFNPDNFDLDNIGKQPYEIIKTIYPDILSYQNQA